LTSRTKYICCCMDSEVAPRANIIIRKLHTTKVNLAHQGMGDLMGGILAECLVGLPLMRELSLRDNRLTDKSLMSIIKAIKLRHDLLALDLSENKFDRQASRALAVYFSDPRATLAKFVLSKADVDDFEAANFVKNMRNNRTLTHLDLSHNLIGSQESINYVQPDFYTGAEALADWVASEECPLKFLDISWNTIRLDSAVSFGKAIASAKKLRHLEIGYNGLGWKGGEAVGASLHTNSSLETLGMESNAINPRACFVICQALMCNTSIRSIDLGRNSLGKVGASCVMALPAELGDRVKVNLSHCNFMVDCEECWFNADKLKSSYNLDMDEPYDRAIGISIMRRAARDDGLKILEVVHTVAGEAGKGINLVKGFPESIGELVQCADPSEIFRKYDEDGSGNIDRQELSKALIDMNITGKTQVDLIMSRYDTDGSGTIEESEFNEFVTITLRGNIVLQNVRAQAFMAEASNPGTPWLVPSVGKLSIQLVYNRLPNQGSHTSAEHADGLLAMLSGLGEGKSEVMSHALSNMSLDTEQGLRMYAAVLKEFGGDKIKALAKVIPRMASSSDARLLRNTIIRELDERRKLRNELGPAYRPLMGLPMGSYELDLSKPMHRLAARKVLEYNNVHKFSRQEGRREVFDVSQKGNWENVRNETLNGKPFRFRSDKFESPPSAGTLEFDYVSTSRTSHGMQPMSSKRFLQLLVALDLMTSEYAAENEKEIDQIIDKANQQVELRAVSAQRGLHKFTLLDLAPTYPRTTEMFEFLHFLLTGETKPPGGKKPIPSKPSGLGKVGGKQVGVSYPGGSWDEPLPDGAEKPILTKSDHSDLCPLFLVIIMYDVHNRCTKNNSADLTSRLLVAEDLEQSSHENKQSSRREATMPTPSVLAVVCCRLDELVSDRWFTVQQVKFLIGAMKVKFRGDETLDDVVVDFVVNVYPRVVDVYDYQTVLECIDERCQAFVFKRVGWLVLWNPCRPDGYVELSMDRREERQVAKMLIHLAVVEPGDNWYSESFRWSRQVRRTFDTPIPGWALPKGWVTEEGIANRGVLTCGYYSGEGKGLKGCKEDWELRVALTQVI
ncbi:unnamed protein product, partial [Discosporangium mesarthrocarpum]